MKVLYDHQIFSYQNYGGISRYFVEIIDGLKKYSDVTPVIKLLPSDNVYLLEKNMNPFNLIIKKGFRRSTWMNNWLTKRYFYLIEKKIIKGVDIFHPTFYDTYYLNYLDNTPFVLTIYDMINEKLPQYNQKATIPVMENKKLLAHKASKIIAISESTKNDIVELYGISPDKIAVIYLGNSLSPVASFVPQVQVPQKYILFVGKRDGYKNYELFVKSIAALLNKDKELYLICVGGSGYIPEEEKIHATLGVANQVHQLNTSDDMLAYLYQHALCFVFPSLYEGFGIPTLEAFACGCPVILSNTSSMPEVGGDAVAYIDPTNAKSIYEETKKLVEVAEHRLKLIEKGYHQLKKFSWQKCVEEHYELYKSSML